MKVKSESEVAQSYPTLSDRMDCSLPGSSIHGIFQARVLEWVAIAFSELCSHLHPENSPSCRECSERGSNRGGDNSVMEVVFILQFSGKHFFLFWLESEEVEGMGSQGLTTVDGPEDHCV